MDRHHRRYVSRGEHVTKEIPFSSESCLVDYSRCWISIELKGLVPYFESYVRDGLVDIFAARNCNDVYKGYRDGFILWIAENPERDFFFSEELTLEEKELVASLR